MDFDVEQPEEFVKMYMVVIMINLMILFSAL